MVRRPRGRAHHPDQSDASIKVVLGAGVNPLRFITVRRRRRELVRGRFSSCRRRSTAQRWCKQCNLLEARALTRLKATFSTNFSTNVLKIYTSALRNGTSHPRFFSPTLENIARDYFRRGTAP